RSTPSGPGQPGHQNDVNTGCGISRAGIGELCVHGSGPLLSAPTLTRHPEAPGCSGRSASRTAVAVAPPVPGTAVIWSTVASLRRAKDPKWVTSALRRCSPNPGTESSADAVIRLDRLLRW